MSDWLRYPITGPDDPRHGTPGGYRAGCQQECCLAAHRKQRSDHRKRAYLARGSTMIDGTGTRRRIQALVAIGWPMVALDDMLGVARSSTSKLIAHSPDGPMQPGTVKKYARLYRRLATRPPRPGIDAHPQSIGAARRMAARRGWVSAMAWDDIDDPDAKPQATVPVTAARTPGPTRAELDRMQATVDNDAVAAVLAGVWKHPGALQSRATRLAVLERWQAAGRNLNDLDRLTGWNLRRDRRVVEANARQSGRDSAA